MSRRRSSDRTNESGFTLMELMVVLSIIAVLLVLVSPTLWKMFGKGEVNREKAVIQQIRVAVQSLQVDAAHGDLPPTFLDAVDSPYADEKGVMPNRTNTGIESLVAIFESKDFRRSRTRIASSTPTRTRRRSRSRASALAISSSTSTDGARPTSTCAFAILRKARSA